MADPETATMARQSTDAESPLVSIVITTYNRPEYLRRAVETGENQRSEPIELIVVDDCSRTPAREVLADVDPDVAAFEIRRHRENAGPNAARNTGVDAASGEYIAFLDDDDRWEPEKIGRQVERFQTASDSVGLVYTGRKIVDDGALVDVSTATPIEGDATRAVLCENVVGTQSAVMVQADVAKETPFDERISRWADLEWYVAVSTKCEFACVLDPLVVYEFAAHNRISDDYGQLLESHRLFVEKYRERAREYGWLFERKMRGYASYRAGSASIDNANYDVARRYFLGAVRLYPLEPKFFAYALATLGGGTTHRIARRTKRLLSALPGLV
jgi:glycosyltransferase involved in cell wall biosynthesis